MRLISKTAIYFSRIFIFFLVLLAFIYCTLSTQIGSQFFLNGLSKYLPGKLKIEHIQGALTSDFRLTNINYAINNMHVSIKSLHLAWQPLQLFKKKIVIDTLESNDANIDKSTSTIKITATTTASIEKMLALLKHVVIRQIVIKNITWSKDHNIDYVIDNFLLTKDTSELYSFNLRSPLGHLRGKAKLIWSPFFSWYIDANAQQINPVMLDKLQDSEVNFSLSSQGNWDHDYKNISLKVNNINGKIRGLPLQGQFAVYFDNGKLKIQDSYLSLAEANVKIAGSINRDWNIKWTIYIPQLDKVIPASHGYFSAKGNLFGVKPNLRIKSTIQANGFTFADLKIPNLHGNVLLTSADKSVTLALIANNMIIKNYRIPQLNMMMSATSIADKILSQLSLILSSTNQIKGNVVISKTDNFDLTGKLYVHLSKLSELFIGMPELKNADGDLQGTIDLAGTIFTPDFAFNLILKNGHVLIPKLGSNLTSITLEAHSLYHQPMTVTGGFATRTGKAKLTATTATNLPGFPTTLTIDGNNLQLMNLKEYKVIISPNLNINFDRQHLNIAGTIMLPYVDIQPTDFSSVITLPDEVVFEGQKPREAWLPKNLDMNIHITLGDHINLSYENLMTTLKGNLNIQQKAGGQPIAMGELDIIKGKYRAYGNLLKIKEGRLIYNGNLLTNPGLDIRAFKKIKTVALEGKSQYTADDQLSSTYTGTQMMEVGVWVKGTLRQPMITLYSDPAGINQRDILSYLVFGYPQSDISQGSALALLNSLANGTTEDSKEFTNKLQSFLGLSELRLGSTEYFNPIDETTGNTTSVTIGKKIGKNFSLHYSVGFFYPLQVLSLKYLITKNLTLQSETSTLENGADLFYELEKD